MPEAFLNVGRSGRGLEETAGRSLVPVSGAGAYVETESGDTYLDYALNHGSLLLGHAHPRVVEAVQRQVAKGTIYFPTDRKAQALGSRIVEAVPCGEDLVFTSTGTEATYLALRLARAHTGRSKALKFAGAYHGWHDYVFQSTPWAERPAAVEGSCPDGTVDSAGIPRSAAENTLIAPFNDFPTTREIVERHARDLAAVVVEPFMKSIHPVDGFLSKLRTLCDDHGVVLVFDEVMTGFRLAYGGGQEFYGVVPDLATYGKAIGGGLPLGAVCGSREIVGLTDADDPSKRVFAGGTHRHNAVCAAAGLAALDVLEGSGTYARLHGYTADLRAAIEDVLEDASLPCTTLGAGPLYNYVLTETADADRWDVRFAGDLETKEAIDAALLDQGILTKTGTSRRYVSTQHRDVELDATVEAFKSAVDRVA